MNKSRGLFFAVLITSLFVGCGKKSESTTTTEAAASNSPVQAAQPAANNAEAMYMQARDLRDGASGVAVDKAKAFELFNQAAALGDANAMFFVGIMHENGESVPVDNQKAMEWYEKSDKAGCGAAAPRIKELKAKMAKAKKK
jgi:hypothetical protein